MTIARMGYLDRITAVSWLPPVYVVLRFHGLFGPQHASLQIINRHVKQVLNYSTVYGGNPDWQQTYTLDCSGISPNDSTPIFTVTLGGVYDGFSTIRGDYYVYRKRGHSVPGPFLPPTGPWGAGPTNDYIWNVSSWSPALNNGTYQFYLRRRPWSAGANPIFELWPSHTYQIFPAYFTHNDDGTGPLTPSGNAFGTWANPPFTGPPPQV